MSWFLLLFPLSLLFVHYWFTGKTWKKQKHEAEDCLPLPPSPPALPIIGHLHLIGSLPHVSLRGLAKRHGPDVMLLRLGVVPTFVVSSPRAAEAVLRTHDHVMASRPRSLVNDIIMYGASDVAFAPYGEYWRQARKLATTNMLSAKKVQSFRGAIMEEVSAVMAKISDAAAVGGTVDMSELLRSFAYDMACRIVSGESSMKEGRSKLCEELANDTSRLLGGFNVEEYFPILTRVGVLKRAVCAKAERVRLRWADFLDKLIDDNMSKGKSTFDHKGGNFLDILLSDQEEYGLTRYHIKALLTDVPPVSVKGKTPVGPTNAHEIIAVGQGRTWSKPQAGWTKLNCDGSFDDKAAAGSAKTGADELASAFVVRCAAATCHLVGRHCQHPAGGRRGGHDRAQLQDDADQYEEQHGVSRHGGHR
ncbi:hypothetical protein ZWY2020_046235 [Hordeum vulgare]|nr:hypothetical protein ZWY2020_046235 [Hordeum vulgare]